MKHQRADYFTHELSTVSIDIVTDFVANVKFSIAKPHVSFRLHRNFWVQANVQNRLERAWIAVVAIKINEEGKKNEIDEIVRDSIPK